jgi:hypothetical protein
MTLHDRLNELKAKYDAMTPPDKKEIMHRATEELERSGLREKALKAGDRVPDFSLVDALGETVRLGSLLHKGPVVLSFFRGQW